MCPKVSQYLGLNFDGLVLFFSLLLHYAVLIHSISSRLSYVVFLHGTGINKHFLQGFSTKGPVVSCVIYSHQY